MCYFHVRHKKIKISIKIPPFTDDILNGKLCSDAECDMDARILTDPQSRLSVKPNFSKIFYTILACFNRNACSTEAFSCSMVDTIIR